DPTANRTAFSVDGMSNRYAFDNQLHYDTAWDVIDSKTLVGVDYTSDNTRENILFGTREGRLPTLPTVPSSQISASQ
ncbi:hypothetical protein ACC791_36885, partial [Rhizobium ruizarguesonis]